MLQRHEIHAAMQPDGAPAGHPCRPVRGLDPKGENGDKAAMKTETCILCGSIIR